MAGPLDYVRDQPAGVDPAFTFAAANQTLPTVETKGRALVEHCNIRATGTTRGLGADTAVIRYSDIRSEHDGLTLTGGTAKVKSAVERCRILGPGQQIENRHHDGIQLWMGGQLTVRWCHIEGWQNSAIFLKTDVGPIDTVWIDSCWLSCGAWFPIYVRDGGHGRPTRVSITNCVFDEYNAQWPISTGNDRQNSFLDQETKFVRAAAARRDPTWVVWSNNTRPDGTVIEPPGGWIA